jgi:hypothetical protein
MYLHRLIATILTTALEMFFIMLTAIITILIILGGMK